MLVEILPILRKTGNIQSIRPNNLVTFSIVKRVNSDSFFFFFLNNVKVIFICCCQNRFLQIGTYTYCTIHAPFQFRLLILKLLEHQHVDFMFQSTLKL